jgi:hypothetical protein
VPGYVYILLCESWPNHVKIGHTSGETNDPVGQRLRFLQNEPVYAKYRHPLRIHTFFQLPTKEQAFNVEKGAHGILWSVRVTNGKPGADPEMFEVTASKAEEVVRGLLPLAGAAEVNPLVAFEQAAARFQAVDDSIQEVADDIFLSDEKKVRLLQPLVESLKQAQGELNEAFVDGAGQLLADRGAAPEDVA